MEVKCLRCRSGFRTSWCFFCLMYEQELRISDLPRALIVGARSKRLKPLFCLDYTVDFDRGPHRTSTNADMLTVPIMLLLEFLATSM